MANQITVGKKHKILKDTPTPNGMLYKDDTVVVTELIGDRTARVEDMIGRIFHISPRLLEVIV